jgi:selenide, water dikinase
VWRLDDDRALVATVDFITPLVDDARTWGRIAATNAASDVYAMGGRPLFALNIVGWSAELSTDILVEVLEGAADVARAGGWVTLGGHTVDDPEPKFGLAVIGEVHPDRVLTNDGLRVGEHLVLTKPLGIGVVATAVKRGSAPAAVLDAAVDSMVRLNADGARAALEAGASAATDVTGFGLLGHLRKMVEAAGVDAVLIPGEVPILPGARDLAAAGFVPGGSQRNLDWASERLDRGGCDDVTLMLLADAQTSGGLLFASPPEAAAVAVAALRTSGHDAAVIGEVVDGTGRIRLAGPS